MSASLVRAHIVAALVMNAEAVTTRSKAMKGCCFCATPTQAMKGTHVRPPGNLMGCHSKMSLVFSSAQNCAHFHATKCTSDADALNAAYVAAIATHETCSAQDAGRCRVMFKTTIPPPYVYIEAGSTKTKWEDFLEFGQGSRKSVFNQLADNMAGKFERKLVRVERDGKELPEVATEINEGNADAFEKECVGKADADLWKSDPLVKDLDADVSMAKHASGLQKQYKELADLLADQAKTRAWQGLCGTPLHCGSLKPGRKKMEKDEKKEGMRKLCDEESETAKLKELENEEKDVRKKIFALKQKVEASEWNKRRKDTKGDGQKG